MFRKLMSVILVGILAVSIIPLHAFAEEKIEISFWHNWGGGPSGESIKATVDAFNASQDRIVVKPVFVATEGGDSITTKMLTAVAGGTPPDSMLASRYGIAEYMDAITPLNELIARDNVDTSAFYPWALNEASYEGTIIGMPYDGTSRALFYNKDHFVEAGLDPENPPKTLEDLVEYARKLTKKEGDRVTQYGMIPWLGQGWLYSWGWSFGGEFLDPETGLVTPNDPKIVEALTWMTSFVKEYNVQDVKAFSSSVGVDANDPFTSGQVSMIVQGNWMMGQIAKYKPDMNYGVCDIPGPKGVPATTFVGGRAIIIPKGVSGDKLEAAWEWVKWMCTSEEGQSKKLISYEYPAVAAVAEELYKDDVKMQVFVNVLPNGKNRPVVLAGNMMWDELAKAPDLVLDGVKTPQEALDDIAELINREIEFKKAQFGQN